MIQTTKFIDQDKYTQERRREKLNNNIAQWGDEGKGKVVHYLARQADITVRWQGGNNAGHSIVDAKDDIDTSVHAIPVGALIGKRSLLSAGIVLYPAQLVYEIGGLKKPPNLGIDPRVAIIMPWHIDLDNAREKRRDRKSGGAIGTTNRGIGPCYEDNKGRRGIRFHELVGDPNQLTKKIKELFFVNRKLLEIYGARPSVARKKIIEDYIAYGNMLRKYLADVSDEIYWARHREKNVLFEGAQGSLLDIEHGNYPFVTSSQPMVGSIYTNLGIAPFLIRVIGVLKAYDTKVGLGPVVTCLDQGLWPVDESKSDPIAIYIRDRGKERGTTTGRPRRIGWLDLVALKYTHRMNGFDELALMKLDCLSGLDKIAIATGYKYKGKLLTNYISWNLDFLNKCKPHYEYFNGYGDISHIRDFNELPKNAKIIIKFIEDFMSVPITFISVGPDREQTILRNFQKFD
ncbi:adenylosuccinate synthase [Patescibacteria group bacterium]